MNKEVTSEPVLTSRQIATRLEQFADPLCLWLMEYDERNKRRIQNRKFPIGFAVWSIIYLTILGGAWLLDRNKIEIGPILAIFLATSALYSWSKARSCWKRFPTQKHIQREVECDDLYQNAFKALARIARFKSAVEKGPRIYEGAKAACMRKILDQMEHLLANRLLEEINERRMSDALYEAMCEPNDEVAIQRYLDLVDIRFASTIEAIRQMQTEAQQVIQSAERDLSENGTREDVDQTPPAIH